MSGLLPVTKRVERNPKGFRELSLSHLEAAPSMTDGWNSSGEPLEFFLSERRVVRVLQRIFARFRLAHRTQASPIGLASTFLLHTAFVLPGQPLTWFGAFRIPGQPLTWFGAFPRSRKSFIIKWGWGASRSDDESRIMSLTETRHIRLDNDGVAWIDDTNVKVIEVVLDKLAHGSSAEEIHFQYPHLSLAQIYAAFSYYHDHQSEFDQKIEQELAEVDEVAAKTAESPARERLRRAGKLP